MNLIKQSLYQQIFLITFQPFQCFPGNFCGRYFCKKKLQKLRISRNLILRLISHFCMLPLKIIKFFIRGKIFVNLEAHKRRKNLFMKYINNAKTRNFNMNANTFFIIYFQIWKVLAIEGNKNAKRMPYPPGMQPCRKIKILITKTIQTTNKTKSGYRLISLV